MPGTPALDVGLGEARQPPRDLGRQPSRWDEASASPHPVGLNSHGAK